MYLQSNEILLNLNVKCICKVNEILLNLNVKCICKVMKFY
jgi:hypothetical protein